MSGDLGAKIKAGAVVGGAALLAMGVSAVNASFTFGAAMANVGSLIPGNTEKIKAMGNSVQQLAIDVGGSSGDMAAGLYQVVSAFGDTADTMDILRINAEAAKGGVASVSDAIALTSAVTKGYGDTSSGAVQHVSDLAAMTVRLGQTTFPELAGAIGTVTPLTAALGVKQEELFAVMATGTGVTGGAAEVATQLRGVMQSLMAPTDSMTALFKQNKVASGEALIEQKGLAGTIDLIVAAAEKSGKPLQSFIGSIEGQTLALSLSGPQAEVLRQKLAEMGNAAGASGAAFKEQTEGVNAAGQKYAELKAHISRAMEDGGAAIATFILGMGKWGDEMGVALDTAKPVAAFLAVVFGPALIKMGVQATIAGGKVVASFVLQKLEAIASAAIMTFQIGLAIAAWVLMGVQAMASAVVVAASWLIALGPIGLLIAGVVALVAVVVKNWDTIKEKTGQVIDWIRENWPLLLAILTGPFGLAVLAIVKNWDTIKEGAAAVKDWIVEVWDAVVAFLGAIPGRVLGVLSGMWDFIKNQAGNVKDGAISIWEDLVKWVTDLPGKIIGALGDVGKMLYESGKKIIQGLIDGIKNKALDITGVIGGILSTARNLLPFSPAKEGPFSGKGWTTYSGAAIVDGLIQGMQSRQTALGGATLDMMNAVSVPMRSGASRSGPTTSGTAASGGVGGGNITVPIYLDGKEIARYVWDRHGMTPQMARAS